MFLQAPKTLRQTAAVALAVVLCALPATAGLRISSTQGLITTGTDGVYYDNVAGITMTGADGLLAFHVNGVFDASTDGITM
ncbi:MAG TPA: hypothetical protein VE642_04860, partial [Pyrinomonadaceae bacterium]|nr:hypothetical protein [Pyrinomonadaceae bacterium]